MSVHSSFMTPPRTISPRSPRLVHYSLDSITEREGPSPSLPKMDHDGVDHGRGGGRIQQMIMGERSLGGSSPFLPSPPISSPARLKWPLTRMPR